MPAISPMEVAHHVREAAAGSQQAFAWLFRRFAPLVHAIHLRRWPPQLAEELTQECFAIAFARLPQLREAHLFGAWIAQIARRHRPRTPAAQLPLDEHFDAPCTDAGPDDAAEAARVLQAIRTLPEAFCEPLLLRLVEGMSGPEIAVLTGLTPGSVRVNLHRGMAKLRVALGLAPSVEEESDVRTA